MDAMFATWRAGWGSRSRCSGGGAGGARRAGAGGAGTCCGVCVSVSGEVGRAGRSGCGGLPLAEGEAEDDGPLVEAEDAAQSGGGDVQHDEGEVGAGVEPQPGGPVFVHAREAEDCGPDDAEGRGGEVRDGELGHRDFVAVLMAAGRLAVEAGGAGGGAAAVAVGQGGEDADDDHANEADDH